jgi:hypothetical protein
VNGFRAQYAPRIAPVGGTFSASVSASEHGTASITFPTGYFPAAPRVVACVDGAFFNWFASVSSITTSGATVTVAERNSTVATGTITGYWIAVAP